MKKRNYILPFLLMVTFAVVLYNMDYITDFIIGLTTPEPKVVLPEPNQYSRNISYQYVQKDKTFIPYSKHDLMNIFYSFLDNGYDNITFYCPSEYTKCADDMTEIINDQTIITDIGNFVHPYNNFHDVYLSTSSSGEINLKIKRTYTDEQREKINDKVESIMKTILKGETNVKDKILKIHDYIVDNTEYDENGNDDENAYDLFFRGKSKCFGYADAMAIFLDKLGIQNFKTGSVAHVWNAAYIDGEWYHIDVTWDDPVVENGATITNNIRHKFYMVDTNTLLSYDTKEHDFDKKIYSELK